jgi:hypothetical protein
MCHYTCESKTKQTLAGLFVFWWRRGESGIANDGRIACASHCAIRPFDSTTARKIAALQRFFNRASILFELAAKKQNARLGVCFFGGGGENRTLRQKLIYQAFCRVVAEFMANLNIKF